MAGGGLDVCSLVKSECGVELVGHIKLNMEKFVRQPKDSTGDGVSRVLL